MSQTPNIEHEEISGASDILSCRQHHLILLLSSQIHAKRLFQESGLWEGRAGWWASRNKWCFGLGCDCPSKTHELKVWSPVGAVGMPRKLQKVLSYGRFLGHWGWPCRCLDGGLSSSLPSLLYPPHLSPPPTTSLRTETWLVGSDACTCACFRHSMLPSGRILEWSPCMHHAFEPLKI